jgi:hypothetical protein
VASIQLGPFDFTGKPAGIDPAAHRLGTNLGSIHLRAKPVGIFGRNVGPPIAKSCTFVPLRDDDAIETPAAPLGLWPGICVVMPRSSAEPLCHAPSDFARRSSVASILKAFW